MNITRIRTRWAAVGAAVAVSLGAGGIGIGQATTSSGERPIYLPIEPCRLADTRAEFQVGPRSAPLGADETYDLAGWGSNGDCSLPNGTAGLALNVTPVGPTAPTFLTVFPAGVARPLASNLNPTPGQPPTPNAVNVDLNASGVFSVYNLAGNVHVIVDVVGIYDDHNHDDRYYTEAEVDAQLAEIEVSVTNVETNVTQLGTSVSDVEDELTGVEDSLAAVEDDLTDVETTLSETDGLATGYALGPLPAITFAGAPDPQILAEFSLPAGDFIVTTSAVANNNSLTTEARFNCILTLGATTIAETSPDGGALVLGLAPNEDPASRESVALTGGGTLAAPGTARLVCLSDSTVGNWLGVSMTAIKMDSVTRP